MLPVLDLGSWHIRTYGLCSALALVTAGMYSFHRLLRLTDSRRIIVVGFSLTVLAGAISPVLAGALPRILHYLWPASPQPDGSLRITWALLGATVAAVVYCRHYRSPIGRSLDLGLLPVPLGLAIGRLGCVAAGCCAGVPTDSWLGLYLPNADGIWTVRYPAQLLSVAADLFIYAALVIAERLLARRGRAASRVLRADGGLALLFLGLYSLKRFLVAFIREDAPPIVGPLSSMHLYALGAMLLFTVVAARRMAGPTVVA